VTGKKQGLGREKRRLRHLRTNRRVSANRSSPLPHPPTEFLPPLPTAGSG